MRQRAVIAMALVCKPELLIADEPTTALDVTIQAQILGLIKSLQRELGCSVLLITHDLGVVAQTADEVAVMYLGRVVEQGDIRRVLKAPRHPYTRGCSNRFRVWPAIRSDWRRSRAAFRPSAGSRRAARFIPGVRTSEKGLCDVGGPPDCSRIRNRTGGLPAGRGHHGGVRRRRHSAAEESRTDRNPNPSFRNPNEHGS